MKLYIVLESKKKIKQTSKKDLQKIIDSKKMVLGFKDKESAFKYAKKLEKQSEDNKPYILLVQLDSQIIASELQYVIPTQDRFNIFPAKRKMIIKKQVLEEKIASSNSTLPFDNRIWIKIGYGFLLSGFIGALLYLGDAISSEVVVSFSAGHGISLLGANIIVFGVLGIMAAAVLGGLFYALQTLDAQLLEEKKLNEKEYKREVEREKKL